jgi:hypothetical protein
LQKADKAEEMLEDLLEMLKDKRMLFAIGVVFVIQAAVSFWTGQQYDMDVWFNTGRWMNQGINIYGPPHHLGYPPLWAFWCSFAYATFGSFGGSIEIWRFVIKLPLILSHIALAIVVADYVRNRFSLNMARKVFWIILGWSFFIYVGAIWGQINALSALLTFLAFYAVTNQKTAVGGVFLGLAVALKTYPIVALPAFFAFIFRNRGKKETGKFTLIALAVPVVFTLAVFAVFQWDITYFLKTVFYSTPVFEAGPMQQNMGAMNFWSYVALRGIDIIPLWHLRLLWIPLLAICAIYWLKRSKIDEKDFALSIISFYMLFMLSYGWISEQTFIDPLPFIFLFILAFEPKRIYLFVLSVIQVFVYIFTVANQSLFAFSPLLERFSPSLLADLTSFHRSPVYGPIVHAVRGTMGLVTSLSLLVFLVLLMKPTIVEKVQKQFALLGKEISRKP